MKDCLETKNFPVWSESRSVMSNSLWPHGLCSPRNSPGQNPGVVAFPSSRGSSQPRHRTLAPLSWDSPGQNTGVGSLSLLQRIFSTQASNTGSLSWDSPGRNTGVGCHALLQGIFPTQASHPGLPHCRRILYQLGHQGSPRILVWVAYPFSSRYSWPRNQTGVYCIVDGFFTNWAIGKSISQSTQMQNWEFPGGPVVRTLSFPWEAQVWSLLRELRSCELNGEAKKMKIKKINKCKPCSL